MGIFTKKDEDGNTYGRLTGRQLSPLHNERGGKTNDYGIGGREDQCRKDADLGYDKDKKRS
jgi:hypothetical protein